MADPQELQDFLRWKPQYPDVIIGSGLLYKENKAILYGRYKSFKSMLACHASLCLADGQPWLDFETNPAGTSVLYLQLEMPHSLLHKRYTKMWEGWSSTQGATQRLVTLQPIHVWSEPFLKMDAHEGYQTMRQKIEQVQPELVIIDPLYKVLSGNILDPNSVRAVVDRLDQLIAEYKVAILLCHHPRKSAIDTQDAEWGSDDMLGAAVFSWWADSIIKVTRKGGDTGRSILQLNFDVVRYAEDELEPKEVIFDREKMLFKVAHAIKI